MPAWIIELFGMSYREIFTFTSIFAHLKTAFTGFSFKGFISSIVAVCDLLTMLLFSAPVPPRGPELNLEGYELVFADEFDQDELDTENWYIRNPGPVRCGYHSGSQVEVKDGNLIITGEYLENGEFGDGWYTSAVSLKERYKQGYFEIRCKVNTSKVFWSAFWLQSSNPYQPEISQGGVGGAEIDIFESAHYGEAFGHCVFSAIHCSGVDGKQEGIDSLILGFYRDGNVAEYNTYGLEWTEDEYIFYINGVETCRSTFGNGVSQVEQDVIISLEIPVNDITTLDRDTFETEYIVDYVKIYQK